MNIFNKKTILSSLKKLLGNGHTRASIFALYKSEARERTFTDWIVTLASKMIGEPDIVSLPYPSPKSNTRYVRQLYFAEKRERKKNGFKGTRYEHFKDLEFLMRYDYETWED